MWNGKLKVVRKHPIHSLVLLYIQDYVITTFSFAFHVGKEFANITCIARGLSCTTNNLCKRDYYTILQYRQHFHTLMVGEAISSG